jgi:hypothetical protein
MNNIAKSPLPARRGEGPRSGGEGLFLALIVALLAPVVAHACPVCFGSADSELTRGAQNGIWVLLGVIGFVQLGFVALFWTFWRRARALRKRREQFHLIEGGVH